VGVAPELFDQISTGRVSNQIVTRLGDAIREGSLLPGDRLPPERELAERFGVSRVTVRDALRVLEVLGMIEVRVGAGGGPVVRAPGAEVVGESLRNLLMTSTVDPVDIAEARLLLDLGTVALAAARASEEDLEALAVINEEARAHLAAGTYTGDMAGRWHLRLAEATGNSAVVLVVAAVRGTLSMSAVRRRGPSVQEAHRQTIEDHGAILDALRRREGARAQGLMAMHLLRDRRSPEQVRETIIALLGPSSEGLDSVLAAIDG
jgi:GntR family transcriptional regulator, transcriptional repressor for pyruvate dehydrogenase complex